MAPGLEDSITDSKEVSSTYQTKLFLTEISGSNMLYLEISCLDQEGIPQTYEGIFPKAKEAARHVFDNFEIPWSGPSRQINESIGKVYFSSQSLRGYFTTSLDLFEIELN